MVSQEYNPNESMYSQIKTREKKTTWKGMDNIILKPTGFASNYLSLPIIGGLAGELYSGSLEGSIAGVAAGTALRFAPNMVNKYLLEPWKKIPVGMVGVVFNKKGYLFKENKAHEALMVLEDTRRYLKSRREEIPAEIEFYRKNKNLFAKGAKIVEPGMFYKMPGKRYVGVDKISYDIDPEPKIFTSTTRNGMPLQIESDLKLEYTKLPIPFALANLGKLLNNPQNWEQDLESAIISYVHDAVGGHFERRRFPEVLEISLTNQEKDRLNSKMRTKYGVEVDVLREAKRIPSSQESRLVEILEQEKTLTKTHEISNQNFQNTVELIKNLTRSGEFSEDFYKLLNTAIKFGELQYKVEAQAS